METVAWSRTSVGRVRKENEDSFIADPEQGIYVVCDGMGGHNAGEIASATAVEVVHAELRKVIEQIRELDGKNTPADRQRVCELVDEAVQAGCRRVFQIASSSSEHRGMGTTLVCLVVAGTNGYIAHVGDSRIYLIRGGKVYQLTEDHTVVNEQLKRGLITPDEARDAPYKSVLTRAVGIQEYVQADTLPLEVLPQDLFLLCSDGLTAYVEGDELAEFVQGPQPTGAVAKLIDAANERGGRDNITAIVVEVSGEGTEQAKVLQQTVEALKAGPLFQHLTYEEIIKVLRVTSQRQARPGEVIFKEGSVGEEMHVIREGRVKVVKDGVELAQLGTYDHIGEMSFIDAAPRSASIVAIDPTDLITIQKDDFFQLMSNDSRLGLKLLWSFVFVLSSRLRTANAELAQKNQRKA